MEGGSACCASRMEHEEHRTPCRGIQPPCMGQVCFVQSGWHFRLFCHSTLSWDAYDSTGCVLPACRCPGWAGSALAGAGCMCGRGAASVRKKELEQERDKHDLHAFQAFRRGLCGYVSFRLRPKGMAGERIAAALSFSLGQSLTFLVPIGSIFLAFLTNYGLMEFVGVFVRPLMRRIWKTPGRSAIDAVASFVGSYSVALLITDELYTKGAYTKRKRLSLRPAFPPCRPLL